MLEANFKSFSYSLVSLLGLKAQSVFIEGVNKQLLASPLAPRGIIGGINSYLLVHVYILHTQQICQYKRVENNYY